MKDLIMEKNSNIGMRFIDAILSVILRMEDYFCLPASVRASEVFLAFMNLLWFIWFTIFDVRASSPIFNYMFSEAGWTAIFGSFSVLHLAGLWIPAYQIRQLGLLGYSLTWFCWVFIIAFSRFQSTSTPTVLAMFCLSIYVTVRVLRETEPEERAQSKLENSCDSQNEK